MLFFSKVKAPDKPRSLRHAVEEGWELTDELYESRDPDEPLDIGINTCGINGWTSWLAKRIQNFMGVDFDTACWFHDQEWMIKNKSIPHKIDADFRFELNLIRCLTEITVNKLKLAAWFHAIVTVNVDHYQKD